MAYDTTVPAAGHSGSQDYTPMRLNFQQIQTSFSIDHEPLAVGGGIEGYHKKSTYVAGSDPAPVASAGIAYTKTVSGHTELFYEGEFATGSILQITNQALSAASGQGMLPGGLQIRTGVRPSGPGTTVSYTPFPTATISVVCTSFGGAAIVGVQGVLMPGSFQFVGNDQFYWIAIGH